MNILDIIEVKKRGGELTDAQIDQFVDATIDPATPDYQLAALLMAIRINGMTDRETVRLTIDMEHSGDTLDLNAIDGIPVDKHSTGGVGDTTTLILAPLIAACGAPVAKMSGRGLGFTGGTLDKLDSIPGFRHQSGAAGIHIDRTARGLCGRGAERASRARRQAAVRPARRDRHC